MDVHFGSQLHHAIVAANTPRGVAFIPDPPPERTFDEKHTDHGRSWVMLKQNGDIEPLDGESIVLKTPGHVSLGLRVPQGLRTDNSSFSVTCDDGVAYVTNKRVSGTLFLSESHMVTCSNVFRSYTWPPNPRRPFSLSQPSY